MLARHRGAEASRASGRDAHAAETADSRRCRPAWPIARWRAVGRSLASTIRSRPVSERGLRCTAARRPRGTRDVDRQRGAAGGRTVTPGSPATFGAWLASRPRRVLMALVRGYRLLLSPWLGSSCRFEPTCSAYSLQALDKYGAAVGTYMTLHRLARCQPFCAGGHDPLPDRPPSLFRRFTTGTSTSVDASSPSTSIEQTSP